jgi:hypothetical protein
MQEATTRRVFREQGVQQLAAVAHGSKQGRVHSTAVQRVQQFCRVRPRETQNQAHIIQVSNSLIFLKSKEKNPL